MQKNNSQIYKKNIKSGFSLIELIIVLAIMSVISAIAIPNFLNISSKARLKADIQSICAIENAKDLYETETGDFFNQDNSPDDIIKKLCDNGYLKKNFSPQVNNAVLILEDNIIKLNITNCDDLIKKAYNNLSQQEKFYIITSK